MKTEQIFTTLDNNQVVIAENDIDAYRGSSNAEYDGTAFFLKDGRTIYVKENFEFVSNIFQDL